MPDKLTMGAGDTKQYWFRAKTHGIGWQPSTWQGWLVTVAHIIFTIFVISHNIQEGSRQGEVSPREILLPIGLATIALILICVRTGEPLKWRWGRK